MINRRVQVRNPTVKSFPLKGGLNTEVANMERKPGELMVCKNYHERNGAYSGYQSAAGYERYDGQTAPSSISLKTYSNYQLGDDYALWDRVLANGYVFYCIQASGSGSVEPDYITPGSNSRWEYEGAVDDVAVYSDTYREDTRDQITAVGGTTADPDDSASGQIRGLHVYNDTIVAFRDNTVPDTTDMYKASSSGWTQVPASSTEMNDGATIRAINARFAEYPVASPLSENMYWVDGVTAGFFFWDGGASYDIYSFTTDDFLPDQAAIDIGFWENRLFLVFAGGHIFFSQVGDPTSWDSSTGYAGEIFLGEEITGIKATASALLIFTENKIYTLAYGSTTGQFIFKLDRFSDQMGAIDNTVQTLLESLYFCDNRGVTEVVPDSATGGFQSRTLGHKVETEFLLHKDNITATLVDRESLRYFVFYTDGDTSNGLSFTFFERGLKGVGRIELNHKVVATTQAILSDGSQIILFGDDSGYVYRMESGTSYDGETIDTRMMTSFYHYDTPRNWKNFLRIGFEIACDSNTTFTIGTSFNYGNPELPKNPYLDSISSGGGVTYGSGETWGTFEWSSGYLGRAIHYIGAHATTMAIAVVTSSKYKTQHTIHNVTTDFILEGLKQ